MEVNIEQLPVHTHMHYLGSFYLFLMFAKNIQSRLGITQNVLS